MFLTTLAFALATIGQEPIGSVRAVPDAPGRC